MNYHAHPAVSNSTLSRFLQAPHLTRVPLKPTPSLRWGSLVHTILLEPHRCEAEWAVMPEGLNKGKGAKERSEQFTAENAGKEILKADEHQSLLAIREAVMADEIAGLLLGLPDNVIEQPSFWTHPETGIELRCKPDFVTASGILCDVKTTASISQRKFASSFFDYGYHRQSAMYADGLKANGIEVNQTIYIGIQGDEAPEIFIQCFSVPQTVVETGRRHYNQALAQMKALMDKFGPDSAKWPRRLGEPVLEIEQPAYVR